jgi:outer membrane immunogenic protein
MLNCKGLTMKKLLRASAAFVTFFTHTPAYAQYDKDNDNAQMMMETQRTTQTQQVAPVQPTYTSTATTTVAPAPQIEPQAGNEYDFEGPYFGGDVGYTISSADINDTAGPDGDVGLDGWEGGLFLGYGFTWLSGYTGIELGYEWSGGEGDFDGVTYEQKNKWRATVRPGFNMNDEALGYAIIGYSRAEIEGNGDSSNLDGLVLGAGAEFNTQSPVKIRLEYTYTNYSDSDLGSANVDLQENGIKAGLVYRF